LNKSAQLYKFLIFLVGCLPPCGSLNSPCPPVELRDAQGELRDPQGELRDPQGGQDILFCFFFLAKLALFLFSEAGLCFFFMCLCFLKVKLL
jgi:hypothetical protein